MSKSYVYKIFDRDGVYLNSLTNEVITDPDWTEEVNSAGSIFDVDIARIENYGSGTDLAVGNYVELYVYYGENEVWTDEDDEAIVDEDGEEIVFAQGATDGRLMFSGIITRIVPKHGPDYLTISIASRGMELDQTVIEVENTNTADEVTNIDNTGGTPNNLTFGTSLAANQSYFAQQFSPTISGILSEYLGALFVSGGSTVFPVTVYIDFYEGSNPNTDLLPENLIGTETITAASGGLLLSQTVAGVNLTEEIPVEAGRDYFYRVRPAVLDPAVETYTVVAQPENVYGDQRMWFLTNGGSWAIDPTYSAQFWLKIIPRDTTTPFLSMDPSDIVRAILDINVAKGGVVTYTEDSIADTGLISSYTFRSNTVLEGLNKMLEFAPADWYWYLDLGTNIVYFQPQRTTPDVYITKGKEIQNLELEETMEGIINTVYFNGGEISDGVNLYIKRENLDSLALWPRMIAVVSDDRVTDLDSAEIIVQGILERHANPHYRTALELNAEVIDIENITLGMIVGFKNFDSWEDDLIIQVVSRKYTPDYVNVSLDTLLPRVSRNLENIKRNLKVLETQNNPTAPE